MTLRATADDIARATRLLVVVADGVRPDVLAEEIDSGHLPAMARLRAGGGLYTVSGAFPSVTGPGYAPFVMGRHPGHVGMPGLRWYDRTRARARSYSGIDIWHLDGDLAPEVPTLYEWAQPSLAGLMMIARGASHGRVGRGVGWSIRAALAHFRGDARAWRRVEQDAIDEFFRRFARVRPKVSMLGILSPDKLAHAHGGDSRVVRESIRDVDVAIQRAQAIALADGWSDSLRVWVVGDHAHAPVSQHDDLHGWLSSMGHRVLAHPHTHVRRASMALMVGGNAMAHVYLEPAHRTREWWPSLTARWSALVAQLVDRPSIDLVCVALSANAVRVYASGRGSADIVYSGNGDAGRWSYQMLDGDPLQLGGALSDLGVDDAWAACASSPYPDALVQLTSLVPAPRSGDLVVSASADWDLRARFEPTAHVSTHGALLRSHMMVPLLLDAPPSRAPQRTADVVPSALALLGIDAQGGGGGRFDGRSFL